MPQIKLNAHSIGAADIICHCQFRFMDHFQQMNQLNSVGQMWNTQKPHTHIHKFVIKFRKNTLINLKWKVFHKMYSILGDSRMHNANNFQFKTNAKHDGTMRYNNSLKQIGLCKVNCTHINIARSIDDAIDCWTHAIQFQQIR